MSFWIRKGSAKAEEALSDFRSLMPRGGEALIICATTGQEGDLGRLLALDACVQSPETDSADIRVQSVGGFTADLWNRWGSSKALVGSAVRTKIVNELLEDDLGLPSLQTAGGRAMLARLVSAYVPTCESKQRAEEGRTHQGIRNLVQRYHEALNRHEFIEHQFAMKTLADKISSKSAQLEYRTIFVYGFADFTEAQLDLLTACSCHAEVFVLLDWEDGCAETRYMQHALDALLQRGAQLQEDSLARNTGAEKEAPALSLGRAQGFAAEVALLADLAQEEHKRGVNESKTLLVPHMQSYVRALTKELEHRDVPYELDVKTRFAATSFGAALIALLRVCVDQDPQPNGLAFAMSAYSGLDADDVLDLDTEWRQKRSSSSRILTDLALHKSNNSSDLSLIKGYDKSARIGDWSTLINNLYAKGAHAHKDRQFDLLQDATAQKAATTALQELYELRLTLQDKNVAPTGNDHNSSQLGTRILSFDPVITAAELLSALEETSVNQTPQQGSTALLLAEPSRVYGRQFNTAILGGLSVNDQVEQSDVSLDTYLVAKLNNTQLPDLSHKQQFAYRFSLALAKERLYLVAQHQSIGGEEIKPGGLLCQLKEKMGENFDSVPCRYKHHDEIIPLLCSDNPEKQQRIEDILKQLDSPKTSQHSQQVLVPPLPTRGEPARYDLGYDKGMPVSATTLQGFAQCSYNWMLHRFADGKPVERGFNRAEQGNFAHLVLKKFYERLQQDNEKTGIGNRITVENLPDALKIFHQVFASEAETLQGKLRLEVDEQADLEMLRLNMKAFLEGEVDYAPEFIPIYFEYSFGLDNGESDVSDPVDIGLSLNLRGSIDRIDLREDKAALIIDYKRKNTVAGIESQANNHILQGYLYRRVAEKALGVRPVSHSYRSYGARNGTISEAYAVSDNPPERPLGLPKIGRDPQWGNKDTLMDKSLAAMHQSAAKAADGLITGNIEKRENKVLCEYCLFDDCEYKPSNKGRKQ